MDKGTKLYGRALKNYNEGNFQKALNLCEKCISMNLTNAPAVNLKGLLLYLSGELEAAENLWKLNKDYNKDSIAKKYLENLAEDKQRLNIYSKACQLIKNVDIHNAVTLLKSCEESDFNTINVSNTMTKCLMHLGSYEQAKQYIDKVLAIDKFDKIANENKKIIRSYQVSNKKINFKALGKVFIPVSALLIVILIGYRIEINRTQNVKPKVVKAQSEDKVVVNDKKDNNAAQQTENNAEEKKFPYDELKQAIENSNFDGIVNILQNYKDFNLSVDEKSLYSKAEETVKSNGIRYFYLQGRQMHKAKKYADAEKYYEQGMLYGKGNNLYPDILFMLGDCYENDGKVSKAIEVYKEYLNGKYKVGYEDCVLYKLALIYKDIDKDKARNYAERLQDNYSDSQYNNSIIKAILS